jgi:uncharacterized protein with FMN-binding domain
VTSSGKTKHEIKGLTFAQLLPACLVGAAVVVTVSAYQPLALISAPEEALASSVSNDELVQIAVDEVLDTETLEAEEEASALREALNVSSSDFTMPTSLKDGAYTGTAYGYKSYITVRVVILGGKISSISILSEDDDEAYMSRAKSLLATIVSKQSPQVDVVTGATYSSRGIINAVKQALSKAGAKESITSASVSDTTPSVNTATLEASKTITDQLSQPIDISDLVGGKDIESDIQVSIDGPYADGVYTASSYCENVAYPDSWTPYYLVAVVTVTDGVPAITDVYGASSYEDQAEELDNYDVSNDFYLDNAAYGTRKQTGLIDQFAQSLTSFSETEINAVSGATYSSYALRQAYGKALYASAKSYAVAHAQDEETTDANSEDDLSNEESLFAQLIQSIKAYLSNSGVVSE